MPLARMEKILMTDKTIRQPAMLWVILLAGLPQFSETIYTPALPDLVKLLGITPALAQWTLGIYFVGFALGVGLWGKCSDHYGRKPTMLIGLVIYCLASLGCFVSHDYEMLFISRFFQALGISVGSVVTLTIAREAFSGKARQLLFSRATMIIAFSPALGQYAGSLIQHWLSWKYNFLVLFFLGLSLLIYTLIHLPETRPADLPLSEKQYSLFQVMKRMLVDKYVLATIFLVGALNGVMYSYYAEAPFVIIKLLHFTPYFYASLGIPVALGAALGAYLSGKLRSRLDPNIIIRTGGLVFICSALVLVTLTMTNSISPLNRGISLAYFVLPVCGFFMSYGLIIPNVLSSALQNFQKVLGTAGSLLGLSYYCLISVFLFGMGSIHNGTIYPLPIYFLIIGFFIFVVSRMVYKPQ